jgi:hypothetical protein
MKTFDLPAGSRVKVIKATPRKETHGKELVQAISLRLEWWPLDNAHLDLVVEGLQDTLFWTPPGEESQTPLDGVDAIKKHRRCPGLAMPLRVPGIEFTGYQQTIEHGIDETTALVLYGCKLDKFEAESKEGGACIVRWSVASNRQITPELLGELCALEGTEVVIGELLPPAAPIDGSEAAFAADHPDATDLFAAGADADGDDGGDEHEVEVERSQPGTRTARGRDKTREALKAGQTH